MDIMAKLIDKFIKLNKLRWCEVENSKNKILVEEFLNVPNYLIGSTLQGEQMNEEESGGKCLNPFIQGMDNERCTRVKCNPLFLLFGDTTSHHMATEKRHRPKARTYTKPTLVFRRR